MKEIELKFLGIDKAMIIKKLESLGAQKGYEGFADDVRYELGGGKLLRIRSAGGKHYLTYKRKQRDTSVLHADEHEIEISDPKVMETLLQQLGYAPSKRLRKHRIHYTKGNMAYELDTLEGLPTYLEIEAHSKEELHAACKELGLDPKAGHAKSMRELFPERFRYRGSARTRRSPR